MVHGIAIVGGNGSGKTTLGRALAKALGYRALDVEDYSFEASDIPYAKPRREEEIRALLLAEMKAHQSFVLSAVNADLGEEINARYDCILCVEAPLSLRLARVKQRTVDHLGARALPGGDLYDREQAFFDFVAARSLNKMYAWVRGMSCPVLTVDGTQPVEASVSMLLQRFQNL